MQKVTQCNSKTCYLIFIYDFTVSTDQLNPVKEASLFYLVNIISVHLEAW